MIRVTAPALRGVLAMTGRTTDMTSIDEAEIGMMIGMGTDTTVTEDIEGIATKQLI